VAVKWFTPEGEAGVTEALRLLEAHRDETVIIAADERLTLYDAAFVALAAKLNAELVTADARLAQTAACRVRLLGAR
jgi:predicted nucleic acid-binding protein